MIIYWSLILEIGEDDHYVSSIAYEMEGEEREGKIIISCVKDKNEENSLKFLVKGERKDVGWKLQKVSSKKGKI